MQRGDKAAIRLGTPCLGDALGGPTDGVEKLGPELPCMLLSLRGRLVETGKVLLPPTRVGKYLPTYHCCP